MSVNVRRGLAALGAVVALPFLASPALADENPGSSPEDGTAEVVALTQPGVVYETIEFSAQFLSDANNELISDDPIVVTYTCSGFVVNPDGWIGTAGHCVNQDDEVTADLYDAAVDWAIENYYANADEETALDDLFIYGDVERHVSVTLPAAVTGDDVQQDLPARVIDATSFEEGDAALLKVEAKDLNGIPLADEEPQIGDPITSVGYPGIIENFTDHDLTPTFQPGSISSSKTVGGGLLPVYQLSQDVQGGMSGGPTVNADGEVVGVISAGFDGTDLTYASPIGRVQELLSAAGVDPELSETATAFRNGVVAVHDGDRATAVEELEKVVEEQPRNTAAADYLDRAEALPTPAPPAQQDDDAMLWWVVGISVGTALLLIAIVATAVSVARRRQRPTSAYGAWAPAAQFNQPAGRPVGGQQPWGSAPGQQWAQPVGFAPEDQRAAEQAAQTRPMPRSDR